MPHSIACDSKISVDSFGPDFTGYFSKTKASKTVFIPFWKQVQTRKTIYQRRLGFADLEPVHLDPDGQYIEGRHRDADLATVMCILLILNAGHILTIDLQSQF